MKLNKNIGFYTLNRYLSTRPKNMSVFNYNIPLYLNDEMRDVINKTIYLSETSHDMYLNHLLETIENPVFSDNIQEPSEFLKGFQRSHPEIDWFSENEKINDYSFAVYEALRDARIESVVLTSVNTEMPQDMYERVKSKYLRSDHTVNNATSKERWFYVNPEVINFYQDQQLNPYVEFQELGIFPIVKYKGKYETKIPTHTVKLVLSSAVIYDEINDEYYLYYKKYISKPKSSPSIVLMPYQKRMPK